LKYLSTTVDEYLYQDVNYQVSGVTYTGELPKDAKLVPADDVSGVEFYRLEEIPMERLAWPSMHEMIATLKTQSR
jgi:hypothetical protein